MSVEDLVDGQIVVGYVLVADVIDSDGNRLLHITSGDANGATLPWWAHEGLLSAAVQVCEAAPPVREEDAEDDDGD